MIGAGTGIAPFVGFMEERLATHSPGANILFFGCRHADHDFLYRSRLRSWAADGKLALHTAFSRDQRHKIYVTARLRERRRELWEYVNERGAHVYVCGDGAALARDVHDALRDVVAKGGGLDIEEAELFLASMQTQRRYQRDVWVS
eukprot:IDg4542t1